MPKIQKLSVQEIHKIAAGQVVDRPAHVVKELMENALDAGATQISVYIQDGGHTSIRVVDNGCGMDSEDILLCFEHHATSKITTLQDMQSLHTFGFRGEALASIAAVSKIDLITRTAQTAHGLHVHKVPDQQDRVAEVAAAPGTDITIHDIFFNIPARKKFLKKDETEWRAIVQLFHAFCLSHPQVHFQLFCQGQLLHTYPATSTLYERCAQVWQLDQPLLSLHSTQNGISVQGALSAPHITRFSKNFIFCFVNKRWIKNYHITQALLRGYGNTLAHVQFPLACLNITIDQTLIDVNVHPRKEEIQFSAPKQIDQCVTSGVKAALEHLHSSVRSSHIPASLASEFSRPAWHTYSSVAAPHTMSEPASDALRSTPLWTDAPLQSAGEHLAPAGEQQTAIIPQESVSAPATEFHLLGVYHKTYILCELPEGIWMVDQHAAHERVLYEKYQAQEQVTSTSLLFPEVITLSAADYTVLMQHQAVCERFGIVFEPFGHQQIIMQAIPLAAQTIHWPSCIATLVEYFQQEDHQDPQQLVAQLQHRVWALLACKAAVKAGDTLHDHQIQQLLSDLVICKDSISCPHGRPTSWLLGLSDLQKKFRR